MNLRMPSRAHFRTRTPDSIASRPLYLSEILRDTEPGTLLRTPDRRGAAEELFRVLYFAAKPVNASKRLDTKLALGLVQLPGAPIGQLMARLASRNLIRGLSFGLPSGQCVANRLGVTPLTQAELVQGASPALRAMMNAKNKRLLKKTPLWYYVLKEAEVSRAGEKLGPVGGRIVAETFARILLDDVDSILSVPGGFTPTLPSAIPGEFTMVDLLRHAGVIA